MPEGPLLRLAELVRRELGAKNARVEIGGDPPDDPAALWRDLSGGWRVVALFEAPPEDRDDRLARLDALVQTFAGLTAQVTADRPAARVPVARALTAALADLAARAGGVDAVVIDATSPVVWGSSDTTRTHDEDIGAALRAATVDERARNAGLDATALLSLDPNALAGELAARGLGTALAGDLARELRTMKARAPSRDEAGWRRYLLTARAIASARRLAAASQHPAHLRESEHDESSGLLVRAFANIYLLVVAFDGRFSELHAEAALLHALPHIERLVLSLPPVHSPTGGSSQEARVVPLRGRRRAKR